MPGAGDLVGALTGPHVLTGRRIAFSPDLGGLAPVDPEVAGRARAAAKPLAGLGGQVVEAAPDFGEVREVIAGLRPLGLGLRFGGYQPGERDQLSPRLAASIEAALGVDVATVARACRLRSRVRAGYQRFMAQVDLLVTPTWGVPPFRIDMPFEYQIAGLPAPDYFDHILLTYAISVVGAPAVSVPAGLDRAGLPVGLQIAGAEGADRDVLAAALAYELARGPMPRPPEEGRGAAARRPDVPRRLRLGDLAVTEKPLIQDETEFTLPGYRSQAPLARGGGDVRRRHPAHLDLGGGGARPGGPGRRSDRPAARVRHRRPAGTDAAGDERLGGYLAGPGRGQ